MATSFSLLWMGHSQMYIVVWSTRKKDRWGNVESTDHWQTFPERVDAVAYYNWLKDEDEAYTASMCWPILSTDYTISPEETSCLSS